MSNIKLKNANGVEVTYNGVTTIKIPKADGTGNAEFIGLSQLTAPVITLSTDTVSWSAVTNAVIYGVYADNDNVGYTTSLNANIKTLLFNASKSSGTYSITVKAIGNGVDYGTSNASNIESYTYVQKVTTLVGTSWQFNNSVNFTTGQYLDTLNGTLTIDGESYAIRQYNDGWYEKALFAPSTILIPTYNGGSSSEVNQLRYYSGSWKFYKKSSTGINVSNVIIYISSGNLATSSNLIDWFYDNATRIS